jgi:DnaJ-class molecular chaperone
MIAPFTCPTCNGSTTVSKPPWIAGDQNTWFSSNAGELYPCPSCNGVGVIWHEMNEVVNYKTEGG